MSPATAGAAGPRRRLREAISRAGTTALRQTRRRGWLDIGGAPGDVTVKPADYLPVYEQLLGGLRHRRFSLLELGVWKADSLIMWRDAFPRATIVGLDLSPPQVDLGPRVHVVSGDQADAELLHRTARQYAPQGFAVIIDDASHMGQPTARSLQALYLRHLRSGGLYVIEDWATGYVPKFWPDAAAPTTSIGIDRLDEVVEVPREDGEETAQRMPSHDFGLVGLIKRLIDHAAAGPLSVHQAEWLGEALPLEWMRLNGGMVILKKPG